MAINLDKLKDDIEEAAERMGMDYSDLAEMVPDVLSDCIAKIAKLKAAIAAKDAAQVKAIAHDLKGSTANYGILEPSAIAKTLELSAASPDAALAAKFEALILEIQTLDLN